MKVDFDMIFRLNAAQKLVAEHCVSDFYMIFHLTLLTYQLLIFQQLCPFNRDKISSFLIRVLKFHDFYLRWL